MKNLTMSFKRWAGIFIVLAVIFVALPAIADQIYAFSDDLSSNFNLDTGLTRAKLVGGMAFTADDSVSSSITSDIVANPFRDIISARLDVSNNLPSSTRIVYFISNNGGAKWLQVNPGATYTFDTVGNQLSWMAVIARDSVVVPSASIDNIYLSYTVSDTVNVNQNSYNYSSGTSSNLNFGAGGDTGSFVCNVLASLGLGCGSPPAVSYKPVASTLTPTQTSAPLSTSNNSASSGSGNSSFFATIFTSGTKNKFDNNSGTGTINIVRVNGEQEIYEIVGGKKHLIPTKDIFYDYGFTDGMIHDITRKQLDKYPRVKVVTVKGDKKDYYLTEGSMIRPVPDNKISDSYGDRAEDIIEISAKELNYYPRDRFVFLQEPLNRDVFQLVNGQKRYVTPMAVKRMKLTDDQIAPINQTELSYYKTMGPIIF